MKSNQRNVFSGVFLFTILLFMCFLLFCNAWQAGAQQNQNTVLANLKANAKLNAPNNILADFVNGKTETAVIILLKPTAAAQALSAQSKSSAQVPAEFTKSGAPTYYNLQDETIKTQLRATVTETVDQVIAQLGTAGITVTQKFSYQFGFAAKVTPEALTRIVNLADVVTIEKDEILEPHLAQGIPLMNATTVRSTYTGAGISIAICDTGIDTSHPMLGGTSTFPNAKVIGGYDTGDSDSDPRPNSTSGVAHGTACASIAAGTLGSVGDYIGGVAPDAKLYAVKISTGTSGSASTAAMIAGWEWCVTHQNDNASYPIKIISTSFGGSRYSSSCDTASSGMTTAAANAVAAGITIFASSGNDGYCSYIAWPACISYVNSVGAVYDANFGTYYPCITSTSCAPTKTSTAYCTTGYYATDYTSADMVTSYSNSASFLTLFAPSNKAYTADIVGSGGYSTGDYYDSFGGTSAACPYAAGAAAVLQQAAKAKTGSYLTPAQVKSYLVNNGDSITDGKVAVTKPRINLGRAINSLPSYLYTAFSSYGLYKYDSTSWSYFHTFNSATDRMAAGTTLYAYFSGAGLWKYDGASWTYLHPSNPASMTAGTNFYASFSGYGLYKHDGTNWSYLHPSNPASMAAGSKLHAFFSGYGLYKYDGSAWSYLHPSNPASMAAGTNLYASFSGAGLWKYDGTTWTYLHPSNPTMYIGGTIWTD